MSDLPPTSESPKWDSTTKMVVALTVVALVSALLIYFRSIIGPLILAFIISFLLHPVVAWSCKVFRISWKVSVNLLYLLLVVLLAALLTLTGFAIVQQATSLINFVERFLLELPAMLQNLSTQVYMIGPFQFDFTQLDLDTLATQLLNVVQPLLGQAGGLIRTFAASAANILGWGLFLLLVSYFLLSESGQLREDMVHIEIPGYGGDFERLADELLKIWDAFLRGQLLISLLVVLSYYVLLTILGTRLTLAIALMAGLARFIPYIGPLITWTVTAIVAFLQTSNYYGLNSVQYAILVLALCFILDQIFDNLVNPRLMGRTLGVHPAGVLIAAIVAANLIGILGLVLAAPVLATLALLGRYVIRKMFDMQPFPPTEPQPVTIEMPWVRLGRVMQVWIKRLYRRWKSR